ncbi:putative integral membrane protein [Mesorhizobium delmotii]|uniref:Putative integral membrane protein n=2 Tax=Mesorhizobium delmotii TaxID=1631247 RepID=A0A2P9AT53_9HYPH|nr:putative integral membrane protein [Mesorhizobium delmotii]
MGEDEIETLRLLTVHREIVDGLIVRHRGRIANTAGDSVLAEFPSAVDAVQCGTAIQQQLGEANANTPEDSRLQFRIGIHVGDVMIRGGDLFGDGVNIAARLQALAEPGGLCLSAEAYAHVRKTLPLDFQDLGPQQVKNIAEPVRVYSYKPQPTDPALHTNTLSLPLPENPSIAVLPFTNMGGDRYFADGVVEDIITALSHVPRLFVIARNSTFTYRDRMVDIRQIGRELGVRYVLEGSVRRASGRIRITGQLLDAATGAHLWADHYDGDADDVFDLQDEVTASVVGAISPRLLDAEIARMKIKRPENLDAYDLFLRALEAVREMTLERNEEALSYLERALRLDPDYAVAAGLAAWAHTLRFAQIWRGDAETERKRGIELGRTAVAKGPDDSEALAMGGYAVAFLGNELKEGLSAIERAISLNPNSAFALANAGWVRCYLGQAEQAINNFERSVRLSPREGTLFRVESGLAFAHLFREEFEEAVIWGRRALAGNPNYTPTYRALACALAHLGRIDEAKGVGQRLRDLVPNLSADLERVLFRDSGKLPLILSGLRLAGLPA